MTHRLTELDPADPLADLPGSNPQSAWKGKLLTTLADRALTEIGNHSS